MAQEGMQAFLEKRQPRFQRPSSVSFDAETGSCETL